MSTDSRVRSLPDCMMPDGAEPCKAYQQLNSALSEVKRELEEAKGLLNLKNDEYVQQIGTWKIIQRLEDQVRGHEAKEARLLADNHQIRKEYEAKLKLATEALDEIEGYWTECDAREEDLRRIREIATEALSKLREGGK